MEKWGISPEDTGAIQTLQWSPDHSVLAVGYEKRGLTVWSIYGCRLMNTIPQPRSESSKNMISLSISIPPVPPEELLSQGVSSLAWGPEGYFLVAGQSASAKLSILSFCKSLATSSAPTVFFFFFFFLKFFKEFFSKNNFTIF